MPHCPVCQVEYEEGVDTCADCWEARNERIALVPGPPQVEPQTEGTPRTFQLMRQFQSRSTIVFAMYLIAGALLVFGMIGFIGNAVSIYHFGNQRSVLGVVGDLCQALVFSLQPAALTFGLAVVAGYLVDIRRNLNSDRSQVAQDDEGA